MKTPSQFYAEANEYVEKFYGTRAGNFIKEGNEARAELKARLLDEYIEFRAELKGLLIQYPKLSQYAKIEIAF